MGLISRVIVGSMWLFAGVPKVIQYQATMTSIYQYNLLPRNIVPVLAILQPIVEIILGIFLLVGIAIRWASLVSIVLLAVYIAGIISLGVRNMKVSCGCFSLGSYDPHAGWNTYSWDIVRDVGFIVLASIASIYTVSWNSFRQGVNLWRQGLKPYSAQVHNNEVSGIDLYKLGLTEEIIVGDKPHLRVRK